MAAAASSARRFPPPWVLDENPKRFRDATGQVLGYFDYDDGMRRRSINKRLTKAEVRRMAVNFAGLPEVLRKARPARK